MSELETELTVSRRIFLQLGSAALVATGCNSQPSPESAKTQPAESPAAAPNAVAQSPKPIAGTSPNSALSKEYVQTIGRFAYLWGWPIVNSFNRRTAMTSVPEPGLRGGILPNAPTGQVCMLTDYISPDQRFVTCSNQDVVYGFCFAALDDSPVVYQVPDFGNRFWVYAAWDARTDSFAELGHQYQTKPGFYLLVGPNWSAKTPEGVSRVFRSPTELAALCPRVFMDDTPEDHQAIQSVLSQVMAYPLNQFDGKMKTKDWKKVPSCPAPAGQGAGEIQWVNPEVFFDQLPGVLDKVSKQADAPTYLCNSFSSCHPIRCG